MHGESGSAFADRTIPNGYLPERTIETDLFTLHIKQICDATNVRDRSEGSGSQVWNAGERLVHWLCAPEQQWIREVPSAVELGSGTGIVAVALAKLGVARVLATDRSQRSCDLCVSNAARNGVWDQVRSRAYEWGVVDVDELRLLVDPRSHCCPSVIVLSDCLFEWGSAPADRLESSLRALVSLGGCRAIIVSWEPRNNREEIFLERLQELGSLSQTTWHVHEASKEWFGVRVLRITSKCRRRLETTLEQAAAVPTPHKSRDGRRVAEAAIFVAAGAVILAALAGVAPTALLQPPPGPPRPLPLAAGSRLKDLLAQGFSSSRHATRSHPERKKPQERQWLGESRRWFSDRHAR